MRDGEGGRRLHKQQQRNNLDGRPRTMAFFKRKNLLSRRTCSYCFVVVAMASLFILYYCHRQPSSLSSDVYIHSDTRLQKLNGQERTLYQNNIINDLSPFVGGGSINGSYRFVLGLNYWEQLTMATMNLFQLACLSDNWNASVIQPFTLNSRLYGLRNFKAGKFPQLAKPSICLSVQLLCTCVIDVSVQ